MKKLILTCFMLLGWGHIYSQKFSVGIVGGFASTDVSGVDTEDGDVDYYRLGVTVGGFVNRSFNDRTSVQLELLYATKGSLQPADSANNFLFYKLRLDYVEIPILIKYKMNLIVNKEQLDKLEVEAGPTFAQLVNSWQKNNNGEIAFDQPFNKSDILFNLGLNYYFSKNFSLDVRFENSIVPVRPHPGNAVYLLNRGEYNSAFNYTFRYSFE